MNTHKPIANNQTTKEPKLLNASFNQDQGCFAICHENGFAIYNTDPMELRVQKNFAAENGGSGNSGIGYISMLHRTNYLSLVGGGKSPKFPISKIIIWDDLKKKASLVLEFNSPVLKVLLSRIRIIGVLKNQVYVYIFSSPPKLLCSYESYDNEHGICELSSGIIMSNSHRNFNDGDISNKARNNHIHHHISNNGDDAHTLQILAFPGRSIGQIQLVDVSPLGQERNLVSIIKAHKSRIRCLALNRSGTMIASASDTGTIIRIHSTTTCNLIYEFRRGIDKVIITSMSFSPNSSKLAVLSDKNTLHVYSLNNVNNNRQHILHSVPFLLPSYFKSKWSFCSIHLNETNAVGPGNNKLDDTINDEGVLGWSDQNSIIIIWKFKGKWEKYVIDEKDEVIGKNGEVEKNWEIIREGWRSFGDLK
ncbi:hypothetical protein PACTADRAFT_2392 [Pachysolen tannophilus NRRL Y-2460]|uniref:SVP1-like protein 2 n=1 Tax=Pachysolen tannophilus NRRL Y-2460 TaxID=669874 RepID=A0A1E4TWF4_PACTA|nr:hypothetical protein PACTADRAFT_2392 [Pachysolen tannophilus NRRL Y-2460]